MIKVNRPNDISIYSDDCVETFLSPDQQHFMQFDVSALGRYAATGRGVKPLLRTWYEYQSDILLLEWRGAAARTDSGWSVELYVPLTDLFRQHPAQRDASGRPIIYANFVRHRPQDLKSPHSNWAGMRSPRLAVPSQFKPLALDWDPTSVCVAATSRAWMRRSLPLVCFAEARRICLPSKMIPDVAFLD